MSTAAPRSEQLALFPAESSADMSAPPAFASRISRLTEVDQVPTTPIIEQAIDPSPESQAALRLCVLGSGSGGNCSVVQLRPEARGGPRPAVLIDAGFGPYTTRRRLLQAGADFDAVKAICLTHLDRDHWRPNWSRTLLAHGITVYCHAWHRPAMDQLPETADLAAAGLLRSFDGPFEVLPGLHVTPIALPHDQKGTFGYVFEAAASASRVARLGYATDLGSVPGELIDAWTAQGGLDVLAIESNYDPHLQQKSPRPAFLKRRIMGKLGHLSNQQSFEAVRQVFERCPQRLRRIVLLHRSAQCNHPRIVQRVFAQDSRFEGRVFLTEQRRRSRWFAARGVGAPQRAQQPLFIRPAGRASV